jgi:hypothetical protein
MAVVLAAALMIGMLGDDVSSVAAEAGVDVVDLVGAVNTTGLEPREYLIAVGELAPPPVANGVWDRLAGCESTGHWAANTGNGYFGGVQMDMTFWRSYGGPAFAARPDLASRAQQIAVAERGLARQGWAAWPACSRRLGLR